MKNILSTPAEEPVSMPLPSDHKVIFLAGIFIILLLTAMRAASEIIMPMMLAFILKLILQPALRFLEKFHIPRSIASLIIVIGLISILIGLGTALAGPASLWIEKFPTAIPKLQERLGFLNNSVEKAQMLVTNADDLTHTTGQQVIPVSLQGSRLSDKIFTGTRSFISAFFTTMLVLFFLLASGDTFLRRLVEILPTFKDKRQAVDLSQQIEANISAYLLTITLMNAGIGVITAIIMASFGIADPLLWGALAFLLNFVPILGPITGAAIFLLLGLLSIDSSLAFLPAGLYLLVHFIESIVITPILIARRFTLNPVIVTVALIFWYWMWGFAGAILAMPMLAVTKIICDRTKRLSAFGHFLEG